MRTIAEFDAKNYDPRWAVVSREAVRAIIRRDGKIALVKSEKEHYYKFPGGGIEPGESHMDALAREVREETGLQIKPESVREFGSIYERRKGGMPEEIFEQTSYYYIADITDFTGPQALDAYEAELEYRLEWADIPTAYMYNQAAENSRYSAMIARETYVLSLL